MGVTPSIHPFVLAIDTQITPRFSRGDRMSHHHSLTPRVCVLFTLHEDLPYPSESVYKTLGPLLRPRFHPHSDRLLLPPITPLDRNNETRTHPMVELQNPFSLDQTPQLAHRPVHTTRGTGLFVRGRVRTDGTKAGGRTEGETSFEGGEERKGALGGEGRRVYAEWGRAVRRRSRGLKRNGVGREAKSQNRRMTLWWG